MGQPRTDATSSEQPSLEVKIGQMIMAGVKGTVLADDARHIVADLQIGNIILMGRNIANPAQVLALTQGLQELAIGELGIPALIGTDQEGGTVQRLDSAGGFLPMPDAKTIGSSRNPDAIHAYGRAAGEELAAVGINLDFAPVLDVNSNPDNPVIGARGRTFGATAEEVIETAIPFMLGLRDAGVMACGKHFPGHGNTSEDSHLVLPFQPDDRGSLNRVEIPPFREAIAHGIDMIMPAHVTYPALDPSGLPATVSEPIVTGLLRGELGFEGVIITDDFNMQGIIANFSSGEAAVRAVEAGADMILCVRMWEFDGGDPQAVEKIRTALLDAVQSGRLSAERIDASFNRIMTLKAKHQPGPADGTGLDRIRSAEHFRALARVLDEVANRQQEAGRP